MSRFKGLFPRTLHAKFRSRYSLQFDERFYDITSFQNFLDKNSFLSDSDFIARAARRIVKRGATEPLTGTSIGKGLLSLANGLREGMTYDGLNARMRAIWLAMARLPSSSQRHDTAIYAAEAITPMAMRLRGMFPKFLGSEYVEDADRAHSLYPIPIQDLQALDLRDDAFDIVITNEVLEHVPSIDRALSEIFRILKPGGVHIGTLPFLYDREQSIVRAKLENGSVVHIMPPEYHENPVDPKGGALVFEIPGWNLLQRARATGFSDVHIRFILSTRHGCISEGIGGLLILSMTK